MIAPTRDLVAELNRGPVIIGSITRLRHPRCPWPTETGPVSEM